jgi:hypothetical protein
VGTVADTAEEVTARAGQGIPVRCDHNSGICVDALFLPVKQDQGRLDLLVNSAWVGYEHYEFAKFSKPFREQP